ncbi:peptidoglycan bridge formation glycyltransferase FemA/FemB family protein [Algibacter sp. L1A34]|uniref:peptidoglycan bridge formation glycyltransferase FemA/FemB family protein n=1 Tax=Algibacter sp. L1A34 TaxID=2686365 RepID=UPI00131A8A27|nr:peptidoglycan bridge formation glycyltransferase FemA/FemB family protein [Algibacter sp. L1A34]
MSELEIIKNKLEWDSTIKLFVESDFYHTYDYHLISKKEDETPILIKYNEDDLVIVLPLLIRKIEGTEFKDATSVYGYPGPISINLTEDFNNTIFIKKMYRFLYENNIVSVFSRLNPYIKHQETILKGLGQIYSPGQVIDIDLTKDIESQKVDYNRRLKTYINKSRKQYSTRLAKKNQDIETFIDMYYENMRRVKAIDSYFFTKAYFFDFIKSNSFDTDILLAIDNDSKEIIGGAMFVKKNNIVQYHLSGVKNEYLSLNPIKLLIDDMRIRATKEKFTFFNLGGGVGGKTDSLFYFKSGFSKEIKDFKIWRYIVNEQVYENLVRDKHKQKIDCVFSHKTCLEYFPCYRCNIKY